jgi:hypothetical protein
VRRAGARPGRVWTFALACALIVFGASGGARAAPPAAPPSRLVLLARPDDADAVTGEALARVSGELIAAGFDVRTVRVPAGADPRRTVETEGRDQSPAAAFAIFPGAPAADGTPSAEIWVSDRLTGRATVERLSVDPRTEDRRAAVLAVRAVELLKASVAELWVHGAEPPKKEAPAPPVAANAGPAATVVVAPASGEPNARGTGLSIEATLAMVGHPGGFPVDVGPLLRVCLGLDRHLALRVSAFGLDRGWTLSNGDGRANVRQQLVTAEVLLAFRPAHRVQPRLTAGLGAARLDVTGTGNAPWVGKSPTTWTAVGGVGAGVALTLGRSVALVAEVDVQFFWNRPVVRVGNTNAGQAGQPAILGTAGLRISL